MTTLKKSDSTFGKLIHETQQGKLAKPVYKVKYYDEKQILNNFEKRCYQAAQTGADGAKINYDDITNGQIDQIAIDKLSDSSEFNNKQNDINIDNTLNYFKHLNTITEQIHSEITVTLTKFCHKNKFKLIANDNDYLVIF